MVAWNPFGQPVWPIKLRLVPPRSPLQTKPGALPQAMQGTVASAAPVQDHLGPAGNHTCKIRHPFFTIVHTDGHACMCTCTHTHNTAAALRLDPGSIRTGNAIDGFRAGAFGCAAGCFIVMAREHRIHGGSLCSPGDLASSAALPAHRVLPQRSRTVHTKERHPPNRVED